MTAIIECCAPPKRGELRVDLAAVAANWRDLGARHPTGPVAGVVKADAYGLGAKQVGRALQAVGCRHFFVAQFQEGMALRAHLGPGAMIGVLGGFGPAADAGAELVPVINSLADLREHAEAGQAAGMDRPVILHVDTGMARLGLPVEELAALAQEPSLLRGLDLRYVMTHLACADEPDHAMNERQRQAFAAACAILPGVSRSFANSSGLFLGAGYHSELARPGAALYGINPLPGQANPMRLAARLMVPVIQVRDIPAGVSVGYGATWVAERPTRVATLAAGYADGYPRSLSSKGWAWFEGRRLPVVGRVSMDLITLDVTDAPGVTPGEMVELIGPNATPDDLGAQGGTIGYEMLTSLGQRYQRVYG